MTADDEVRYLGMKLDDVPKTEPNGECNGKKAETTDDGDRLFNGYCSLPAGWGVVEGGEDGRRCKLHGGVPSGGAPSSNQNAIKHGLNSDPHHYYNSLSPEHKQYIEEMAAAIEDRVRDNTGSVDPLDQRLARNIAIELHIVSKASAYVEKESGLMQKVATGNGPHEETAPLLDEIRRYDNSIMSNLKKIGVLDDPESQKADSLNSWRGFVEKGAGP